MSPKRVDAEDTIDTATHFLHRLQAEGWTLKSLEHQISYGKPHAKAPRLPVEAIIIVKMIPIRG